MRLGEIGLFTRRLQLAFAAGLDFAASRQRRQEQFFLDLKLHDIGNTVQRGSKAWALVRIVSPVTLIRRPCKPRSSGGKAPACDARRHVLKPYDDAALAAAG